MATIVRRRRAESFQIHEDVPSTEDAEMSDEAVQHGEDEGEQEPEEDEEVEQADDQDQQSNDSDDSDDEMAKTVRQDMENLQDTFPGFRQRYRLIKRIGEGTFSTVYKAEDLQYDQYDNGWDLDKENEKEDEKWTPPPLRPSSSRNSSVTLEATSQHTHNHKQGGELQSGRQQRQPRAKFVAIKKIYVTSSPSRILNELELLHELRACPSVCPLIAAFRSTDQVVAILPYFKHSDFREYFREMTPGDMAIYLRVLFTALAAVHAQGILHRDIKPTNFLYDPTTRRGVLVDFGLAEREGIDCKPCLCHEASTVRKERLQTAVRANSAPHNGYPKQDTRPSRRANRAGTRGFRAPEVLFKCTEQTPKLDVWSAGIILLTILSRRFPFFNSADDVDALIEIATIFGAKRMRAAGQLHGCQFETTIPTIGQQGFSLERIVLWSTNRDYTGAIMEPDEKLAVEFLGRCLDLDPSRRISAEQALEHEFLRMGMDLLDEGRASADDEVEVLKA